VFILSAFVTYCQIQAAEPSTWRLPVLVSSLMVPCIYLEALIRPIDQIRTLQTFQFCKDKSVRVDRFLLIMEVDRV